MSGSWPLVPDAPAAAVVVIDSCNSRLTMIQCAERQVGLVIPCLCSVMMKILVFAAAQRSMQNPVGLRSELATTPLLMPWSLGQCSCWSQYWFS